jgi:hypothetical protein
MIYDMDIQEESLIPSRKKLFTLQKRKWFYAVAGFILFLLFTIGISCIFFHLGKKAGCEHTQITNGMISYCMLEYCKIVPIFTTEAL